VDALNTALSSLKGYGQRITFASGRLEMLQGILSENVVICRKM